jgi:hypothetical protein
MAFIQYVIYKHTESITLAMGLLATVVCVWRLFKGIRLLFILLVPIFSYTQELYIEYYTGYRNLGGNHWIYNLFEIPILTLAAYAFYYYNNSRGQRRLFGIGFLILLVYHLGYILIWGSIEKIDVIGICYAMIVLGLMSYFYLVKLIESPETISDSRLLFWFSSASLVFYIGRIPITALTFGPINMSDLMFDKMYVINDVLYAAWYLLITLGIIITTKWTKESTSP